MWRAIFTARWNGQSQNERIIEQNEKISMLLSLRVTENLSKPEISSKPQLRAAMIGAVPVLPTVSLWWPFLVSFAQGRNSFRSSSYFNADLAVMKKDSDSGLGRWVRGARVSIFQCVERGGES